MIVASTDTREDSHISDQGYRLQKCGALLQDMRELVCGWSEAVHELDSVPTTRNILTKSTALRKTDIYRHGFKPRFISGDPPAAWRLAQALETVKADIDIIRPFYYWITARAEPLLYAFATSDLLYSHSGSNEILTVDDVMLWLDRRQPKAGEWTVETRRRVARSLLATLRDFCILNGKVKKRVAPVHPPLQAVALIAFCLDAAGISSGAILRHPDWALFLLRQSSIERLFMECHQRRWLGYHAAGNLVRIEFPQVSFGDYVNVVVGKASRLIEE